MKHVFQNLRSLAKNEKFIFAVMLVCVFVSAWIMTFSYGLYHNYTAMLNEPDDDLGDDLTPELAEGSTLTRGDVARFFLALSPDTLDAMATTYVFGQSEPMEDEHGEISEYNTLSMVSRFVVRDGRFIPPPYIVQPGTTIT